MPAEASIAEVGGDRRVWVRASVPIEKLDVSRGTLARLVAEGHIRTWTLPGGRPRYYWPDIERLIQQGTSAAGASTAVA